MKTHLMLIQMMALASQFAVAGPAEKPKSPPQSVKELVERIKLLEGSHEVGNGGGGFLCLDPVSGRIRDLLVLDLIEGQVADRLVYDKSRQLPLDLQISRAVSRLNLVDPALGVKLKRWLSILPAGKATLIGLTKSAPVSDFSPRVDVNPQDFSEYGWRSGRGQHFLPLRRCFHDRNVGLRRCDDGDEWKR
jgi:hypothetical protein